MNKLNADVLDFIRNKPFGLMIVTGMQTRLPAAGTITVAEIETHIEERIQAIQEEVDKGGESHESKMNRDILALAKYVSGTEFNATPLKSEGFHGMLDEFIERLRTEPVCQKLAQLPGQSFDDMATYYSAVKMVVSD